ncbi:MAG: sigma-70 family RNA polymerase sigma factor [Anaerolineae bacterium]
MTATYPATCAASFSVGAQLTEEQQLMFSAQQNLDCFGAVYEHFYPRIYAYILRRVENTETAEDLSSQVFTLAMTGRHTYRGGIVAAWLYRIARNVVVSHYRRARQPQLSLNDEQVADDVQDLAEQHLHTERQRFIIEMMKSLTPEQRALIDMLYFQEMDSEQVAVLLNRSPITVRTRLHRLMKDIRARYPESTL